MVWIGGHETAHLGLRLRPKAATVSDLPNDVLVIQGKLTELSLGDVVRLNERANVIE